jgi:hypothetical protein
MKNYQVSTEFTMSGRKPLLVNLAFHNRFDYFPIIIISSKSIISYLNFFRSKKDAGKYINNLFYRYPESSARGPVLDASQYPFSISFYLQPMLPKYLIFKKSIMFGPNLSELAAVTVRRLAWAMVKKKPPSPVVSGVKAQNLLLCRLFNNGK